MNEPSETTGGEQQIDGLRLNEILKMVGLKSETLASKAVTAAMMRYVSDPIFHAKVETVRELLADDKADNGFGPLSEGEEGLIIICAAVAFDVAESLTEMGVR